MDNKIKQQQIEIKNKIRLIKEEITKKEAEILELTKKLYKLNESL